MKATGLDGGTRFIVPTGGPVAGKTVIFEAVRVHLPARGRVGGGSSDAWHGTCWRRGMDDILHRQWRTLGLRGVTALGFAVCAVAWPSLALAGLFIAFGAYLLVDGGLTLAAAVRVHPRFASWPWLLESVVSVIAGLTVLVVMPLDLRTIGYGLAVWAFTTGLVEAWLALRMRRFAFSGPYWAAGAVISLLLGALLLLRPAQVVTSLVLLLGLYSALFGIAMLGVAWSLRRLERRWIESSSYRAPARA